MRSLVGSLILLMLTGCQPFSEPESMMEEYVERVARVFDQHAELSPLPVTGLFPRRRDRRLPMPELDLSMLDFLSLYGCDLQHVVGERNSGLGRVMQPLNQLRYELKFIHAADDCIGTLEDDPSLREAVVFARHSKVTTLPIAVWNASWGVEEIEPLFTRTEGALPVTVSAADISDLEVDVRLLVQRLGELRKGKLDTDFGFLGEVHQRWQAEDRMGQLIKSGQLLVTRLNDAADIIEHRLAARPVCLNGQPNNQAEIARSMFFAVYAGKVQPYIAAVTRIRQHLLPGFHELGATQRNVMPAAFEGYFNRYLTEAGENSLWRQLDQAIKRHTRLWQDVLGQCGMRPGA
ncbi:DUF3080 domain-containing protein [Marinobacter sp. V034]|uniref:DUF3080 domain-containing protein n=1 Tax=Marinobacter sp. V034 TaxID=3459610 RepID=UPI004044585C